jgi:hypothetical protein
MQLLAYIYYNSTSLFAEQLLILNSANTLNETLLTATVRVRRCVPNLRLY